jgi:hypothetical protein
MSDNALVRTTGNAEVIEYTRDDKANMPAPTLPQAIMQFQRAVEDLSVMDDVILEYER